MDYTNIKKDPLYSNFYGLVKISESHQFPLNHLGNENIFFVGDFKVEYVGEDQFSIHLNKTSEKGEDFIFDYFNPITLDKFEILKYGNIDDIINFLVNQFLKNHPSISYHIMEVSPYHYRLDLINKVKYPKFYFTSLVELENYLTNFKEEDYGYIITENNKIVINGKAQSTNTFFDTYKQALEVLESKNRNLH